MGLNGAQLQMLHKGLRCLSAALQTEGDDTAGAVRHILLGQIVVLVTLEAAVFDPCHFFVFGQELGDLLGIGAVLAHTEGQALQTQTQIESTLGRLDGAKITHQLGGTLGDEGTCKAEPLGVGDTVVAVVGGAQAGEPVGILCPVELAAVYDAAAHRNAVTVHVLGGGVGDDVSTPLDGTAVDGGSEGVVHHQGHAVLMGNLGKLLNVQHIQSRVGDGLTEQQLGVGTESGVQLFLGGVGADEGHLDAHAAHGDADQIEGAAVDGGACHDVVTAGCDVEHGVEVGSLTGAGEHGSSAAFQGSDPGSHHVAGGVLEPGVEVAFGFQIKELAHVLRGSVLEGGALNDGDLTGLAAHGGVAGLDAKGFGMQFLFHWNHLIEMFYIL